MKKTIRHQVLVLVAVVFLTACATVQTHKGIQIGEYQYGGRVVQLVDEVDLPMVTKDGNIFVKLLVNGQEGWYYFSEKSEFTILAYYHPVLKDAKEPRSNEPWVSKGSQWEMAGIPHFDVGFFKAEKYLAPVINQKVLDESYPPGPEGPLDGVLGVDLLSGFTFIKEKSTASSFHLKKGNPPLPPPEDRSRKLILYLPGNSKEMDAKIKVSYFNPTYIQSIESYYPPRMFVNLVGLKVLDKKEIALSGDKKLMKYELQLGPGSTLGGMVERTYRVPVGALEGDQDIYAEMIRRTFKDSGIQSGWVKLLNVNLEGEELVFTLGASILRPLN